MFSEHPLCARFDYRYRDSSVVEQTKISVHVGEISKVINKIHCGSYKSSG